MRSVRIEVLTVNDCPHRETVLHRIREALRQVGADDRVVTERVVEDLAAATASGMHGSPTVLIDGRDPFVRAGVEPSLSCRVFPTATGFDGAPSVDELVAVLSRPDPLDR